MILKSLKVIALGSIAMLCVAATAQSQGLLTVQRLSAALANQLVGDSVAICAEKGHKVVAVVVDLEGVRQAVLRGRIGAGIRSSLGRSGASLVDGAGID